MERNCNLCIAGRAQRASPPNTQLVCRLGMAASIPPFTMAFQVLLAGRPTTLVHKERGDPGTECVGQEIVGQSAQPTV